MPDNTLENEKMMRDNAGKHKLSYLLDFPNAIKSWVKVMEFGAEKYQRNNWKKGGPVTECEDSLLRHLLAFHQCEDHDAESKELHLGHVMFNAAAIIESLAEHGTKFDDRYRDDK